MNEDQEIRACEDCGLDEIELFGGLCEDCDTQMFKTFWTGDDE
jgi:NMD protein affecting ribosome stability and mRNA decay|tara:strand:+ start:143 stop:271 length:129 start_codon:yes stop_codon:yes gene_type:complete